MGVDSDALYEKSGQLTVRDLAEALANGVLYTLAVGRLPDRCDILACPRL